MNNPKYIMLKTTVAARVQASKLSSVLLFASLVSLPMQAAEPTLTDSIEMSVTVGQALTAALDLMDAGQHEEAASVFQRLREQTLNDYEVSRVLLQQVNLDIRMNNHQAAIDDSETLLQTNSLSAVERSSATLMLSKLYLQVENWSKGVETLLQLDSSQRNSNQEILYLLGFGHYRMQESTEAVQWLEQALAVNPTQATEPLYSLLGVLYVEAKNFPKALTTYEALTSAIPDAVQAESYLSTLAQLYVQAGNKARAKSTLTQLIAKYPNSTKLADYKQRLASVN